MLFSEDNRLVYRYDAEVLWIEPWGENALRVRATKQASMSTEDWALSQKPVPTNPNIQHHKDNTASITNGKIRATVSSRGKIMMYNSDKLILEEYARHREDLHDPKCSPLKVEAREFKPHQGQDSYHLILRLESISRHEKLYGMGQYQQPYLNIKGMDLELAQRNSQASVPFLHSSLGYGLLWNNPAIGRCVLGHNIMSFEAYSTTTLDYWITAGETPAQITEAYAHATGTVPMMPEYGLGFWQSKLRYQTQDELLHIAREYRGRNLPLDVIVADFFHWPLQGEWKFDPVYWPDPAAMVSELQSMNIELMVSIWPTVDKRSSNYAPMLEAGHLIRADRGVRTAMTFMGDTIHADFTSSPARSFVWSTVKRNYFGKGIKIFWLDEAEPEFDVYGFDAYRYSAGPVLQIGNIYPLEYARAFFDGQTAAGQSQIVNLLRCAWAGSQRFGALVWSGDVASSWASFRCQLCAGLSMGLAGLPWWTSDIGGFHGGDPTDPAFRELLVRWFQWGAFCPVMRLHGDREPKQEQVGESGGAECRSGAANEVWSFGKEVEGVLARYLRVREGLREYTRGLMREAHERGTPVMRPCFYDFPQDEECWEVEDQYLFGAKYLVAPVLEPGLKRRRVYLPKGAVWRRFGWKGQGWDGGRWVEVECPIEDMPVFMRA